MYANAALSKRDDRFHLIPLTAEHRTGRAYCGAKPRFTKAGPVLYVPDLMQTRCPHCYRAWLVAHCTQPGYRP